MVKHLITAYVRRGDIAPGIDVHARVDTASAIWPEDGFAG